jgi:hypothetical protein
MGDKESGVWVGVITLTFTLSKFLLRIFMSLIKDIYILNTRWRNFDNVNVNVITLTQTPEYHSQFTQRYESETSVLINIWQGKTP